MKEDSKKDSVKETILLVEDEESIGGIMKQALTENGYRVIVARNGEEYDKLISENLPDLAIFDVKLPEVNGLELIRELKKKYPGVPVIVHSAYDRIDGYDDVKQQIEHYLVKPTPLTELKAKVKETMSKYKKLKKTTIPMNIIVVDDEKEICDFLTKYFMDEGHSAKSALTAKEAIELVKKEYFNIAFLDIVMPEVSGMEVLNKIKEISPDTKTIMITGKLKDANFFKQLKQSGASECLEKPFNMKEIQKTLTFHGDAT